MNCEYLVVQQISYEEEEMIWLMNVRLWIVFSRVACIGEYVTILTKLVWEEENSGTFCDKREFTGQLQDLLVLARVDCHYARLLFLYAHGKK